MITFLRIIDFVYTLPFKLVAYVLGMIVSEMIASWKTGRNGGI